MDNIYLKTQEIINYPTKKLPVVFCVDVSASMSECDGELSGEQVEMDGKIYNVVKPGTATNIKIDQVNNCIDIFNEQLSKDLKAKTACQAAYITFGDKATLLHDFTIVKNYNKPSKIEAKDNETYIVPAIKMALKKLDEQKKLLKEQHIGYWQPWLIILTDGEAHDNPNEIFKIKQELLKRQEDDKLTVYTIALDTDNQTLKQLHGYSKYKSIVYDRIVKDKNMLKEFFRYLQQSVSSISNGKTKSIKGFTPLDDVSDIFKSSENIKNVGRLL